MASDLAEKSCSDTRRFGWPAPCDCTVARPELAALASSWPSALPTASAAAWASAGASWGVVGWWGADPAGAVAEGWWVGVSEGREGDDLYGGGLSGVVLLA